jgi:hypothetical protein
MAYRASIVLQGVSTRGWPSSLRLCPCWGLSGWWMVAFGDGARRRL